MGVPEDRKQLEALYLPSSKEFVLVDVPDMQFAMIDGSGADSDALADAVRWLYAIIHPIRPLARERLGKNFAEPPPECLWWADDPEDFVAGRKDRLHWRMMIVIPDWVDSAMFDDAVAKARAKLGEAPASLRLERFAEGRCVQIMYVGPPAGEGTTITRLHDDFLPANGLAAHGAHHEIYLTDPRRVAPEKMKTVLRQPVRQRTRSGKRECGAAS